MLVRFLISSRKIVFRNGGRVRENLSEYNFGTYMSNNLKAPPPTIILCTLTG